MVAFAVQQCRYPVQHYSIERIWACSLILFLDDVKKEEHGYPDTGWHRVIRFQDRKDTNPLRSSPRSGPRSVVVYLLVATSSVLVDLVLPPLPLHTAVDG